MADLEIYTGLWWDYAADAAVLTLSVSSAAYLISGLTLLVSLAGIALWTMVAYIWHQSGVSPDGPVDYRHLQLQVLLRNVTTPASALLHAAKLFFAWPKTGGPSHRARLLVLALTAGLIMALFGVAGVFVGAAVASPSQEDVLVLAKPIVCGDVRSAFNQSASGEVYSSFYAWKSSQAFRAREYAKVWYAGNVSLATAGSSAYPVRRLPYTTSRVPCPFSGGRCRFTMDNTSDADTAMAFDTGLLDSSAHLGINGPVQRSVQFRRKTTCMPFKAADLWLNHWLNPDDNQTYAVLLAGPYQGNNFTKMYNEQLTQMGLGYYTGAVSYNPSAPVPGGWTPIPLLARNDSVVHLFNILANTINYFGLTADPIFLVSGKFNRTWPDTGLTVYFADNFVTTLVCLDQYQFCNPRYGLCTAELDPVGAMLQLRDVNPTNYQMDLVRRIVEILTDADMFSSGVGNLGVSGLLANELVIRDSLSPALPPDQWIREVRLWFETGLATIQERTLLMLDISPFNSSDGSFNLRPMTIRTGEDLEAGEWECSNQKIRSRPGQAQNFSVVRLVAVVVAAGTVLVMGLVVEPCVGFVRRVRGKKHPSGMPRRGQVRQFARAADNLYWLLHAGLRGSGAGGLPWRYGDGGHDGSEEGVVRDEEVPMLDVPGQFWPPVNEDGSWAPFYRCGRLDYAVDHDATGYGETSAVPETVQNGCPMEGTVPATGADAQR